MIKKLLIISSLFMSVNNFAQQIPNAGFETWASGSPTGWGTSDDMLAGTGFASGTTLETQVSPGNSGTSACQMKTQNVSLFLIGAFDVPGIVNTGSLTLNLTSGAIDFGFIPYSSMPASYSFYHKFSPVNGDTAATICYFTKWNSTTNTRDTVGGGGALILNAASAYTMINIPITWVGTTAPDSVQLFFISSIGTAQVNTTLTIDDITMNLPQGINNMEFEKAFNAYPNPASNSITIYAKTETKALVNIIDMTGRTIGTYEMDNYKKSINLENFESGLYLYTIIGDNNKVLHIGKFSVSK